MGVRFLTTVTLTPKFHRGGQRCFICVYPYLIGSTTLTFTNSLKRRFGMTFWKPSIWFGRASSTYTLRFDSPFCDRSIALNVQENDSWFHLLTRRLIPPKGSFPELPSVLQFTPYNNQMKERKQMIKQTAIPQLWD